MSSWIHRVVLAGLLLAAYLWAWTPARTAWTTQGAALIEQVMTAAGAPGTMTARPTAHAFRVGTERGTATSYAAPAGIKFLLPGLFLLLLAPSRPSLGPFFAGHLLLGALALALLAIGAAGLPAGRLMARFVQTYGTDAYSLAAPVFVFTRRE